MDIVYPDGQMSVMISTRTYMDTIARASRNSNIELLRLIAMTMIILSHCSIHSTFPPDDSTILFNNIFLDLIKLGNIGTDIFFLISGYFLCDKTSLNYATLLRLLAQVWFYSILCYGIHLLTGGDFIVKEFIPVILPTIFKEYWFFTVYIILLTLSPYINTFIKNTNPLTLRNGILYMMVLWSIIPTFTANDMYVNELILGIMLYLIGAYIKTSRFNFGKYSMVLAITSFALLFLSSIIIRLLSHKILFLSPYINYFYSRTSLLSICLATSLFTIFTFSKERHNKFINLFGGTVFGIYLFHDNPFIRKLIWQNLLDNAPFYDSPLLPLRIIFCVSIVYSTCFVIELIRKKYIEPLTIRFINKYLIKQL